jgi:hypothetical protein
MASRRRKRINKVVRVLAQIYERKYEDVLQLYNKMDQNVSDTKAILNLTSS